MKRIMLFGLILAMLLGVCGCRQGGVIKGVSFDAEDLQLTTVKPPGNEPHKAVPLEATYSRVMEELGEGGIIAAGYATGKRKSVYNQGSFYTKTSFVVTEVYKGRLKPSTIELHEAYAVLEKMGERYYDTREEQVFLPDDLQVLVFLKPLGLGKYKPCWRFIPLTEDYKAYDEAYLKSVLAFFRGDKSQYIADAPWAETHKSIYTGEEVDIEYYLDFWPTREIDDTALLQELNDHLLIRLATEYKLALWPYGHKNFDQYRYADVELMRICIPWKK